MVREELKKAQKWSRPRAPGGKPKKGSEMVREELNKAEMVRAEGKKCSEMVREEAKKAKRAQKGSEMAGEAPTGSGMVREELKKAQKWSGPSPKKAQKWSGRPKGSETVREKPKWSGTGKKWSGRRWSEDAPVRGH